MERFCLILFQKLFFLLKNLDELKQMIDLKIGLSNLELEINLIKEQDLIYTTRNKYSYIISE